MGRDSMQRPAIDLRTPAIAVVTLVGCYTPRSAIPPTPAEVAAWSGQPPTLPGSQQPAGLELDVDAAIAYAKIHGRVAAERRNAEAVASAQIDAAGQLTNPELRFGRTFDRDLGAVDRVFVALRLHPDMPWERWSNVAAARAHAAAVESQSLGAERDMAVQIRRLYATLAFGEATQDVMVREIASLEERQRVLTSQVAHGTATQLEASIADEALLDLERARGTLEIELARARSELAAQLGVPHGQTWQPVWDLAKLRTIEVTFARDALAARALASRPELAEVAHRLQGADARAYHERTKRVPWFDAIQIERSIRRSEEWAVYLQLTLPVFSQNSGAIAAADAEARAASDERRLLAVRTLQDVDAAIALARVTGARARELADRLPPLDKAVAELVAQSSSSVAVDQVKLLLLQERHGQTERAALAAALEHRLALITLAALTGGS